MRAAFGYDDNLGLPAGFEDALDWEFVSFHELGAMLAAFVDGRVQALFTPVGSLPWLDAPYEVVAQATMGSDRMTTMSSVMVNAVDAGTAVDRPTYELRLGRVNGFCTTSYWAPMISLLRESPQGTKLEFVDAAGFDDMFESVFDGRADAAMVWTAVLANHPDLATRVHERFRRDDLPTPVVITRPDLDANARAQLEALASLDAGGPSLFYSGLTTPDRAGIDRFLTAIDAARRHFT